MKAVLMAFHQKWCEKIFSGEKTVDVRKIAPKLETPYKAYVYQTKGKEPLLEVIKDGDDLYGEVYHGETVFVKGCHRGLGKVVGEFVCDKVIEYDYVVIACAKFEVNGAYVKEEKRYNAGACLSAEEMYEYSKGKSLCGLHIFKPKRYDTPKDIKKFRKPCPYGDLPCRGCPSCEEDESGYIQCFNTVNRPPQSWCYVEEIEE